ncbi:MAG: Holliday junction branch migration protein RuvA [Lachnospiraceae bacterium]|nr:Holliday junction branch migration protein RuvA [Lachnospiraceae bacterium]
MFAYIKGTVEYIHSDYIVVENNGVGFKINTSTIVSSKVSMHEKVTIHTHLSVKEDDMSLFGFLSRDELSVFKLLISISGIGPKGALAILSTLTIDELRIAILSDDHKAISKANGIGAKTAQRVVIELKDKFKLEDVLTDSYSKDEASDYSNNDNVTETAMALTSLGYSNVEALRAIKKVKDSDKMSVEELLKAALKFIM